VQRIKTSDHKFITFILIMALAFICICSHSDYADWLLKEDQAGVHSTASAVDGADRQLDGARILEGDITTGVKNSEQFTRVRQCSKGNSTVPDLACIYSSIQADSLSVNIPFLLVESELTLRYSVIVYLHRSDGKKSALIQA
jgi:hypothetical protein